MSEPIKTTTPPVPSKTVAPVDNTAKANLYALKLREEAGTFIGKKGCNPFIWIRDNLAPLEDALAKGDATAADKILALKIEMKPEVGPVERPTKL